MYLKCKLLSDKFSSHRLTFEMIVEKEARKVPQAIFFSFAILRCSYTESVRKTSLKY